MASTDDTDESSQATESSQAAAKRLTNAYAAKLRSGMSMGAGNMAQLQQKLYRMAFPSTGAFADGSADAGASQSPGASQPMPAELRPSEED